MTRRFVPNLSKLQAYSLELHRLEPFAKPFLAVFKRHDRSLYYVAAHHSNHVSSATFRLIRGCFATLPIDLALLEGFAREEGLSPEGVLADFSRERGHGFYAYGEPSFAAAQAADRGIPFLGAEPPAKEVCRQLLAKGYSAADVLGFHFVQQVPQYKRDGTLPGKSVRKTFAEFVERCKPRLGLTAAAFDYKEFLDWYPNQSGTRFSVKRLTTWDVAPIGDGTAIQRISAADDLIRNRHILGTTASVLGSYKHVLVVYGASHLACQRPVLEDMLGRPVRQARTVGYMQKDA